MSNDTRRKTYVAVNCTKFRADCFKSSAKLFSGKAVSYILLDNGITDSLFSNTYRNYLSLKNKDWVDENFVTEGIERCGYIQEIVYKKVLETFKLNDVYRLPKRENAGNDNVTPVSVPTVVKVDNTEIAEQLKNIEMSINRLGNVMMQILEKMPKNTAVTTDNKPMAKIIDRK